MESGVYLHTYVSVRQIVRQEEGSSGGLSPFVINTNICFCYWDRKTSPHRHLICTAKKTSGFMLIAALRVTSGILSGPSVLDSPIFPHAFLSSSSVIRGTLTLSALRATMPVGRISLRNRVTNLPKSSRQVGGAVLDHSIEP